MLSAKEIRNIARAKRQALSPQQQLHHAESATRRIITHPNFLRAKHIAFYLANDGELNPELLLQHALTLKKACYLPVLHPVLHNTLWFMPFTEETPLVTNRYGIPEPELDTQKVRPAWSLDLVFVPIVAFDANRHRLGMGGGYYDRSFAFTIERPQSPKPTLWGLAHEVQQADKLIPESWDVPMDLIVTEQKTYSFSNSFKS